ncbi:hypothetical protein HMPREF0591_0287, partial [Mycobacterium parascrofulaceum ATCC BAA-614]
RARTGACSNSERCIIGGGPTGSAGVSGPLTCCLPFLQGARLLP